MSDSNTRGLEDSPTDSGSSTGTDTGSNAAATGVHPSDLTLFKLDILAILAEETRYGLAIKRGLEDYYGEAVNHGRLYPNLDDLVDDGLVDKSELDKRTNQYELTQAGRDIVHSRASWLHDKLDLTVEEEEQAIASIEKAEDAARTDGGGV